MKPSVDPSIIHIYETWHNTVRARDLAGTAALYAEDAILETPLALAVYPTQKTGIVISRNRILTFLKIAYESFQAIWHSGIARAHSLRMGINWYGNTLAMLLKESR